ncbi:QVR superfamily protein crim [Cochliomyia hominivorax]
MMKFMYILVIFLSFTLKEGLAIWCYRCTSATPGCGEDFNWRGIGFLGEKCPESEDICVKVTEKRGAQRTIIRDCLSSLSFRTDIPADKYEGCRPAAKDVRLANYVNHTIKEHDVKRDYFNDVEFCFCFLDHRCNGAEALLKTSSFLGFSIISLVFLGLSKILF